MTTENKRLQKDVEARWTKKHRKSHFGYKNHIGVDRQYKIIRRYSVTAASVNDSQEFEALLEVGLELITSKPATSR